MKFAQRIYLLAGVYGVLVLTPMYFKDPGVRPEFYYGFVGLALVWQIAFFVISRDPLRYRSLLPVTVLEKLCFGIPTLLLYSAGRVEKPMLVAGLIDLLLGALFVAAWLRIKSEPASLLAG